MSKLMRELKHAEESRLAMEYAQGRAAANADAEHVARGRIASNASRLIEIKALELAENEARQLAQIRASSERTLAAQAQALAEAERKMEMAAIERRSADLDATREATARAAMDAAAREATENRTMAERQASEAASSQAEAARLATVAAEAHRQAVIERQSATMLRRRAQWSAFWAGARFKPVATIGVILTLLGLAGGLWLARHLPRLSMGAGTTPELYLRLDDNLDLSALRIGPEKRQK
jgi:cobalamin biosynthesis Mg chelatase CobN